MTIAQSKAELAAVAEYEEFMRDLFRGLLRAYTAAGNSIERMNQLQTMVQGWAQAEPGTTEALLYEIHTGIIPSELNSFLFAVRSNAEAFRAAVQDADQASGSEWFGVTGG